MRRRTARIATAGIALLGALAVWLIATRLFSYHSLNHDEAVYLQQAAMLLEGQVNLYPPVEDAMRPWFFVEDGDRLYPKYAPVPAAMFALGELLGAYRLALPAVAAGILALVVGVVSEAFDRRTGLLAAGFVLASPLFLLDTAVFLPYAPTTLLNLSFAYAYLRADRTRSRGWAAIAGGAIGLAFFSRPFTAVLFAAPFVVHALWTLHVDFSESLPRQAATAGLGLAGVALALGYNAVLTGSPVLFPYQAFAPLDGLGFGLRRILNHEIVYTPELALRANARVIRLFVSTWFAGGLLGSALGLFGLLVAIRRGLTARQAALAGLFVSIVAGNVYFWGNFNVLGDLERAGDGLVAYLGPYYHFDLLLPTAAFAARGSIALGEGLREIARSRFDPSVARAVPVVALLVAAGALGIATVNAVEDPIERNLEVTRTYERAYAPFEGRDFEDALVFLPDPYGDWLNHPFQVLRNDPGFDGDAVYAIGDRPFDLAEAFTNRTLYRYTYRGTWAPFAGSPAAARLQRVREVRGDRVTLNATIGVPPGAEGVTIRLPTESGAYHVVQSPGDDVSFRLVFGNGTVRLYDGPTRVANGSLRVEGPGDITTTAFVDYGPGGGITYRFDVPVATAGDRLRALTPRIEWCRAVQRCGGAATYVPETAPTGVFVRANLTAERNP